MKDDIDNGRLVRRPSNRYYISGVRRMSVTYVDFQPSFLLYENAKYCSRTSSYSCCARLTNAITKTVGEERERERAKERGNERENAVVMVAGSGCSVFREDSSTMTDVYPSQWCCRFTCVIRCSLLARGSLTSIKRPTDRLRNNNNNNGLRI